MREYRKFLARFALYDKTGICKYLENKAADGWLLVDMGSIMWEFKRIEPQKLKFSVSYVNNASMYDASLTESQKSFVEYCEHTGWTFAASYEHTFVFYTENEDTVPIETDAVVEVENINNVMKRKMLLPYLLLIVSSIINLSTGLSGFLDDTVDELLSGRIFIIIPLVFVALFCLTETVEYIVWYIRAKRLASLGDGFLSTKNFSNIKGTAVVLLTLTSYFVYCVSLSHSFELAVFIGALLAVVIILVTTRGTTALLKRLNVPKIVNRVVSFAVILAVSVACLYISVNTVMKLPRDNEQGNYYVQFMTQEEFRESAPLEITDFIQDEIRITNSLVEENKSASAVKFRAEQSACNLTSDEEYTLSYTVFDIKIPFVRRACINHLFDRYCALGNYLDTESYPGKVLLDIVSHREISAEKWSADEAYVLCVDGKAINRYLLCYGNKIVEFIPSWELTAEQVKVVAETFG